MKRVLVLQTESAGEIYLLTNQILKKLGDQNCEIIEVSSLGLGGLVLISSGSSEFSQTLLFEESKKTGVSFSFLNDRQEKILKCYYSLYNGPLQDGLLVLESSLVTALFSEAEILVEMGLDICEFRVQKTTSSPGVLWLTGPAKLLEKIQVSNPHIRSTLTLNLHTSLKEFLFN